MFQLSRQQAVFEEHWPLIISLVAAILIPMFLIIRRYQRLSEERRCLWYFTAAENASSSVASTEALKKAVEFYAKSFDLASPSFSAFQSPGEFQQFQTRCQARKARALFQLGDFSASMDHYQEAIKAYKSYENYQNDLLAQLFHQLGLVLRSAGQTAEALNCFSQAARIDPTWSFVSSIQEQTIIQQFIKESAASVAEKNKKEENKKETNQTPVKSSEEKEKEKNNQTIQVDKKAANISSGKKSKKAE